MIKSYAMKINVFYCLYEVYNKIVYSVNYIKKKEFYMIIYDDEYYYVNKTS